MYFGKNRFFCATVMAIVVFGFSHFASAQQHGHGHAHGSQNGDHDEVNMPGLRGDNASKEESDEIRLLFRHFESINREVENLPDGIRTMTWSTDSEVMSVLINHSVGMIDRVERGDDPKILIQSPTLDSFFLHGDEITSDIQVSNGRLTITQTSNNAELVKALQIHAAEVSAMAEDGMRAVHEMMTKQGRGH